MSAYTSLKCGFEAKFTTFILYKRLICQPTSPSLFYIADLSNHKCHPIYCNTTTLVMQLLT